MYSGANNLLNLCDYPRYHPHWKITKILFSHSLCLTRTTYRPTENASVLCSTDLLRSVPAMPSSKWRSQSVTPYSCRPPDTGVSFIAFILFYDKIIAQLFSECKRFFKNNAIYHKFSVKTYYGYELLRTNSPGFSSSYSKRQRSYALITWVSLYLSYRLWLRPYDKCTCP